MMRVVGAAPRGYKPPTEVMNHITFDDWLRKAKHAEKNRITNETEHFYFMSNAPARDSQGRTFIGRDLSMFSTDTENFFITNVAANKGIQCRFGMRGIIAECHYDTGKNMVAMLKGTKRYILNPPSACNKLAIIKDKKHPSWRHSEIDWSNEDVAVEYKFGDVPTIDTIVRQGEVLYIPSFWFHYIISLDYSVQCNSRSGIPESKEGQKEIEECLGIKLDGDHKK
jgi:hypothetical protein